MKDIKTKECGRAPKLRNPVSRMPKELMRDTILKTKEKSQDISEIYGSRSNRESPAGYAGQKVESTEERAAGVSVRAVSTAGRIMVKKSFEKARGYIREQPGAIETGENAESCMGNSSSGNVKDPAKESVKQKILQKKTREKPDFYALSGEAYPSHKDIYYGSLFGDKEPGLEKPGSGNSPGADRIKTKIHRNQAVNTRRIKAGRNQREIIQTGSVRIPGKQSLHTAIPKKTVSAAIPKKGIASAVMPKTQAGYAMKNARQMAVKSARAAGKAAQPVKKTAGIAVKGIMAAIKAAVSSTKLSQLWRRQAAVWLFF